MLHISIAKHARYLQPSSKLIAPSYDEAIKRALSLIPYPLSPFFDSKSLRAPFISCIL